MRSGMAVWLKEEALVNDALKGMGQAKKAPGEFDLLRPESFSCDHPFLREWLSICAYGMPSIGVRLSLVGSCSRAASALGCLSD